MPGGVQGLDRYAYVNNSPVRYTDPSGHDAWWCNQDQQCENEYYYQQQYVPGTDYSLPIPEGLTAGGKQAWHGLFVLHGYGFWNNSAQAPMETLVANEFGSFIDNYYAPILTKAMAHRYAAYCSGGPWTSECINNFWAYHQPILDAARHPESANHLVSKVDDFNGDGQVTVTASTILNPPSAWFADLLDGQKWDDVKCGPTSHYLCEYAVVSTDQTYYTTVTDLAGDALSYGSTAYALQVPGGVLIVTSPFQLAQDCSRAGVPSDACSYPNFP